MLNYLIDFIILILIYLLYYYKRWKREGKKVLILNTLMYTYMVMVLFVTIMPFPLPYLHGTNKLFLETVNLIPFRDLRLNYYGAKKEILLNIIMTMPFGFLYPTIKKAKIFKTIFITLLFSLIIETAQLLSVYWGAITARAFDVTDLITNTSGGLVGYLLYRPLGSIIHKTIDEK